jgi:hypothetical protein
MIALLRHLVFEDFWLKLFSLALAVMIWLTVTFVSQKEVRSESRVFSNLRVAVLASAEDVHNFKLSPNQVEVIVQGDPRTMQTLETKDIRATVDLTGVTTARELRKPVQISVPPGVTCTRIVPAEVQVIFPPER